MNSNGILLKESALVILAGGCGSRMGGNKRHLRLNGALLLQRTLSRLSGSFAQTVISVPAGSETLLADVYKNIFQGYGITLAEDRESGRGPLEGLYAALTKMSAPWGFVIGCDMPYVSLSAVSAMAEARKEGSAAVVARIGAYLEPLHAFYHKRTARAVDSALKDGRGHIKSFYDDISLTVVEESTLRGIAGYRDSFFNVNTPADLAALQKRA